MFASKLKIESLLLYVNFSFVHKTVYEYTVWDGQYVIGIHFILSISICKSEFGVFRLF